MTDDYIQNTKNLYNSIADTYAKKVDALAPNKDRELFISLLKPESRILDIGCAAGRDSMFFSAIGYKVTGIDISNNLLSIAREKAPKIDFINGDIRTLHFKENSFDAIWACAVLLHLKREEIPAVLENLYSMINYHGVLYIRVKQGEGEGDVVDTLSDNKSRHFTYFMPDEMKLMVERVGFKIEQLFTRNERESDPKLRDLVWISVLARK